MTCGEVETNEARTALISPHLQAVQENPDLMGKTKVSIVSHATDRTKDVFRLDIPYAHGVLPVVLAYSSRLRKPPEIYLKHEDWPNFVPRLDSIAAYNLDDPETTVAIIKELVFKATCFQANRLRNPTNLFVPVDEAVVQAFQILAQMTPDQLQLVLDPVKGEVAWTVSLSAHIPTIELDRIADGVEGRYLLKGKTSVIDLSKTKCTVDAFSQLASFFQRNKQPPLSLPKLENARLDEYVQAVAALIQETVYLTAYAGLGK